MGKTPEEIKKGLQCSIAQYCTFESCPYYEEDKGLNRCIEDSRRDAFVYIEQLENQIRDLPKMVPKWISVEERLPDRNEKVVVTDGVHTWDYGEFSGLAYSFARENERNPHKWNWKKHTVRTVNWWMPKKNALPEPPKEESHE